MLHMIALQHSDVFEYDCKQLYTLMLVYTHVVCMYVGAYVC